MKKILRRSGLDCPVCAGELQADLQKIKGVKSVSVDYISQSIALEVTNPEVVALVIEKANAFEEVCVLDGGRYALNKESHLKEWLLIGVSAVLFLIGLLVKSNIR